MPSTIVTKNSSTASAVPVTGDLTQGELAVNVTDKKLYTKDSGGTVVKLVGGLGNQEANAVAITGGSVNGTTIGATTASTGAFTTLSASSTVSGTGFSTYLASPPAIGGTAAAAGSFTTLSASGNTTLSGGTANGVAYLNGSKVVTTGSALTFDGTNLGIGVSAANYANYKNLAIAGTAGANIDLISGSTIVGNIYNTSTDVVIQNSTSGPMRFSINGSEQMRLTSTGLGIGTTSPSARLNVSGGDLFVERSDYPIVSLYRGTTRQGYLWSVAGSYFELVADSRPLFLSAGGANYIATYTNGSERARITSGGEVYIAGTTDQGAYNLQVNGTGVWGAGAYVNGSDARLKEEVQDLAPALDVIASLRPVTFRYKEDYSKDQNVQPGFIAQELQTAMAGQAYVDGVIQSGPQHLNVAYQSLIPLLTKAIQELKAEFDAYKATHP